MSMGETAENLAHKYGISRKEQEEFALASHKKAAAAQSSGGFTDEIVPITAKGDVSRSMAASGPKRRWRRWPASSRFSTPAAR